MISNNNLKQPFSYFLLGLLRLKEPGIRKYVIAPLIINIIVFGALGWFAFHEFHHWLDYTLSLLPHWLSFLSWILWPLFTVLVLMVAYFTFTVIANVIASPFNALLAERIQTEYGFKAESNWKELLLIVPASLKREGQKILYYLPRIIILLIISFIPLINIVSPVLWFVFSSWMMTVQYADYAADNRKISFREMLKQMKHFRGRSLAFGALTLIFTMIPVLNILVLPASVVGATCLWEEKRIVFQSVR